MIWCYRTRVGQFELPSTDSRSRAPEIALRKALIAWRSNLIDGGDLKMSSLSRHYHPSIYTHCQHAGSFSKDCLDDHHSPTRPEQYAQRTHHLPASIFVPSVMTPFGKTCPQVHQTAPRAAHSLLPGAHTRLFWSALYIQRFDAGMHSCGNTTHAL